MVHFSALTVRFSGYERAEQAYESSVSYSASQMMSQYVTDSYDLFLLFIVTGKCLLMEEESHSQS